MSADDLRYVRTRAAEERERASLAASPGVRAVHLDFARKYDRMAGQLSTAEEIDSAREAIHRSLDLLSSTFGLVNRP